MPPTRRSGSLVSLYIFLYVRTSKYICDIVRPIFCPYLKHVVLERYICAVLQLCHATRLLLVAMQARSGSFNQHMTPYSTDNVVLPVVEWSTIRMLIMLGFTHGWSTASVD